MRSKARAREVAAGYDLALAHTVDEMGDDYDYIQDLLGLDDYVSADFGEDAYKHEVLEGATVLARVTQEEGIGACTDYILLCKDGRLAYPNTLAGMVMLTTRTDWTGPKAAIAIGELFDAMDND